MSGKKCEIGCTCGRHKHTWVASKPCELDCTCAKHTITEQTRKKISKSMKEVCSTEESFKIRSENAREMWTREGFRESQSERVKETWSSEELRRRHSEIMKVTCGTEEVRELRSIRMSKARRDSDSPVNLALQEVMQSGWWSKSAGYYNDTWMRCLNSEGVFARCLDEAGIRWLYEPKCFKLSWCSYTPDFYLPEFDIWVEVKGWMTPRSQQKIDSFRREISKTLVVVSQTELPSLVFSFEVEPVRELVSS